MTVCFVEVVAIKTGDVIKRMGPMLEREASRVEAGIEINLNHDEYYVRVVKEKR